MKKLIALLALAAMSGCTDRTGMNQEERIYSLALPPAAENVRLLNPPTGSWHTFEMSVEGGPKLRYLRHYTFGDAGTETMIVLPQR